MPPVSISVSPSSFTIGDSVSVTGFTGCVWFAFYFDGGSPVGADSSPSFTVGFYATPGPHTLLVWGWTSYPPGPDPDQYGSTGVTYLSPPPPGGDWYHNEDTDIFIQSSSDPCPPWIQEDPPAPSISSVTPGKGPVAGGKK